ncbi:hypothetical protein VTI74DRAFT_1818 [Chaetomium olivicolor]
MSDPESEQVAGDEVVGATVGHPTASTSSSSRPTREERSVNWQPDNLGPQIADQEPSSPSDASSISSSLCQPQTSSPRFVKMPARRGSPSQDHQQQSGAPRQGNGGGGSSIPQSRTLAFDPLRMHPVAFVKSSKSMSAIRQGDENIPPVPPVPAKYLNPPPHPILPPPVPAHPVPAPPVLTPTASPPIYPTALSPPPNPLANPRIPSMVYPEGTMEKVEKMLAASRALKPEHQPAPDPLSQAPTAQPTGGSKLKGFLRSFSKPALFFPKKQKKDEEASEPQPDETQVTNQQWKPGQHIKPHMIRHMTGNLPHLPLGEKDGNIPDTKLRWNESQNVIRREKCLKLVRDKPEVVAPPDAVAPASTNPTDAQKDNVASLLTTTTTTRQAGPAFLPTTITTTDNPLPILTTSAPATAQQQYPTFAPLPIATTTTATVADDDDPFSDPAGVVRSPTAFESRLRANSAGAAPVSGGSKPLRAARPLPLSTTLALPLSAAANAPSSFMGEEQSHPCRHPPLAFGHARGIGQHPGPGGPDFVDRKSGAVGVSVGAGMIKPSAGTSVSTDAGGGASRGVPPPLSLLNAQSTVGDFGTLRRRRHGSDASSGGTFGGARGVRTNIITATISTSTSTSSVNGSGSSGGVRGGADLGPNPPSSGPASPGSAVHRKRHPALSLADLAALERQFREQFPEMTGGTGGAGRLEESHQGREGGAVAAGASLVVVAEGPVGHWFRFSLGRRTFGEPPAVGGTPESCPAPPAEGEQVGVALTTDERVESRAGGPPSAAATSSSRSSGSGSMEGGEIGMGEFPGGLRPPPRVYFRGPPPPPVPPPPTAPAPRPGPGLF